MKAAGVVLVAEVVEVLEIMMKVRRSQCLAVSSARGAHLASTRPSPTARRSLLMGAPSAPL